MSLVKVRDKAISAATDGEKFTEHLIELPESPIKNSIRKVDKTSLVYTHYGIAQAVGVDVGEIIIHKLEKVYNKFNANVWVLF